MIALRAAAGLLVLAVVGCGAGESSAPVTISETRIVTQTPSASDSPTESIQADPEPIPSESSTSTDSPIVIPSEGTSRPLALADAFSASAWEEGAYQRAGEPGEMRGFSRRVYCHSDRDNDPLEFRFGSQPGKLRFDIAQELRSVSSSNRLQFSIQSDGRVVETKTIGFKERATLIADVTGVASLEVLVVPVEQDECEDSSMALITAMELTG